MISRYTPTRGAINNARRMLILLSILEDHIKDYNESRDVVGLSMWGAEAFRCMFSIERDNGL